LAEAFEFYITKLAKTIVNDFVITRRGRPAGYQYTSTKLAFRPTRTIDKYVAGE